MKHGDGCREGFWEEAASKVREEEASARWGIRKSGKWGQREQGGRGSDIPRMEVVQQA